MAMGGKGRFGKGKGKPNDKNKRRGNALFRRRKLFLAEARQLDSLFEALQCVLQGKIGRAHV